MFIALPITSRCLLREKTYTVPCSRLDRSQAVRHVRSIQMRYRLEISAEALEQLRVLPKDQRRRIGEKLDALQIDLHGDLKKLAGQEGKYRLRVGSFRVLFTLEKDLIFVHIVKNRKDAYRD